jgi:hypothetical protein
MDSSIPILNLTAEQFFDSFRIKVVDQIYLYGASIVSLIGSILNLFCVWIFFRRKEFDQPFFLFYKILSVNSFLHDFFGIWYSICYPNWYFSFKYQTICVNFVTVFVPFHIFFHNHAILVDIGLLFEMLKLFNQRAKRVLKLDSKKMAIITFALSVVIGVLGSFVIGPNEMVWFSYEKTTNNSTMLIKQQFLFHGPNEFARTRTGSIYFIAYSLAVHVPLISIQFISNLVLILVMKKHFSEISLQSRSNQSKRKERLNKRTSIMALLLCSISLISRIILLIGIVTININPDFFANITLAISDFIAFFNAGILFFVCFSFNKIFRNHVLGLIGIRISKTDTSISNSRSQNRNL